MKFLFGLLLATCLASSFAVELNLRQSTEVEESFNYAEFFMDGFMYLITPQQSLCESNEAPLTQGINFLLGIIGFLIPIAFPFTYSISILVPVIVTFFNMYLVGSVGA